MRASIGAGFRAGAGFGAGIEAACAPSTLTQATLAVFSLLERGPEAQKRTPAPKPALELKTPSPKPDQKPVPMSAPKPASYRFPP
jgi:hypothetical protein